MVKHTIKVCMGSSCYARGNEQNLNFLEKYIKENNLDTEIDLYGSNCIAQCTDGPNIKVDGILYNNIDENKLADIIKNL